MKKTSGTEVESSETFRIELSEVKVKELESLMELSQSVVKPTRKPPDFQVKIKPLKLEEATCHLEEIGSSNSICAICFDQLTDETNYPGWQLNCPHLFHKDCLTQWFRYEIEDYTCPLCRKSQLYQGANRIFYRG